MKPYYETTRGVLYCGDTFDVSFSVYLKYSINSNSVSICYNINLICLTCVQN